MPERINRMFSVHFSGLFSNTPSICYTHLGRFAVDLDKAKERVWGISWISIVWPYSTRNYECSSRLVPELHAHARGIRETCHISTEHKYWLIPSQVSQTIWGAGNDIPDTKQPVSNLWLFSWWRLLASHLILHICHHIYNTLGKFYSILHVRDALAYWESHYRTSMTN